MKKIYHPSPPPLEIIFPPVKLYVLAQVRFYSVTLFTVLLSCVDGGLLRILRLPGVGTSVLLSCVDIGLPVLRYLTLLYFCPV